MGIMGWASTDMAVRYQHLTDPIRADIAKRVGGLIWKAPDSDSAKLDEGQAPSDEGDDGAAGVPVAV
jgi:integrase